MLLFLLKLNIKLKKLLCQCYTMIFKVHTTPPCWRNVVQVFIQSEGIHKYWPHSHGVCMSLAAAMPWPCHAMRKSIPFESHPSLHMALHSVIPQADLTHPRPTPLKPVVASAAWQWTKRHCSADASSCSRKSTGRVRTGSESQHDSEYRAIKIYLVSKILNRWSI